MGVRSVSFLGRNFRSPGSRSAFRAKPQPASASEELQTMIIVGSADNGWNFLDESIPMQQRVMDFGGFDEAKAILGSGQLADACYGAFNPSKDSRFRLGPQLLKVINLANNQYAEAIVGSVAPGINNTVRALVPGIKGNSYRLRVSNSGTTVQVGDTQDIQTSPPLQADEFSLEYTGNATSALLTMDGVRLKVVLTGQTDSSQGLDILLSDHETLGRMISFINSRTGYTAELLSQPDSRLANLDHVITADAINIASSNTYTFKSLFFQQQRFLVGNELLKIVEVPGQPKKPIGDMLTFVYLSGGSTSPVTPSQFIDALAVIEREKIKGFYIALCSTDLSVHLALADRLGKWNSIAGRLEKIGSVGVSKDLSHQERIDQTKWVASEYVTVGYSPVTNRKADLITTKDFDGWYVGMLALAIKSASNVRETPTFKDLNILGVPEKSLTETQKDSALSAGCVIVERKSSNNQFAIVRALTSYQNENIILNELSIVSTALALIKDFRESTEQFIGEVPTDPRAIGTTLSDEDLTTFVEGLFENRYIRQFGWLTANAYDGSPAYDQNFKVMRDGDAIYFSFADGKIVNPINFIFSLMNLDVVRGSTTA
jgi:hypothetical protein